MNAFDPWDNEAMLDRIIELDERLSKVESSVDLCSLQQELQKCRVVLRQCLPFCGGALERKILEALPEDQREPIY